ncbi:hypothetical protein [Roseateles sp.]|uniref:hypothetical protein n=1 Tax=Roseateles sp. TaxID=1971397 RepID=UPI002F3EE8BC
MSLRFALSSRAAAAGMLALVTGMTASMGGASSARADGAWRHSDVMPSDGVQGDLTALRATASRAAKHAAVGELASARRQTQALKRDWDAAASSLQPRLGSDRWRRTSRSLDDALDALQAKQPSQAAAWLALADLLLGLHALDPQQGTAEGAVCIKASVASR